jgi:hypothetical protein
LRYVGQQVADFVKMVVRVGQDFLRYLGVMEKLGYHESRVEQGRSTVEGMRKSMEKLMKEVKQVEKMEEAWVRLSNLSKEGYDQLKMSGEGSIRDGLIEFKDTPGGSQREALELLKLLPVKDQGGFKDFVDSTLNGLSRFSELFFQYTERIPHAEGINMRTQEANAQSARITNLAAMRAMGMKDGKASESFKLVEKNAKVRKAFNDIARIRNEDKTGFDPKNEKIRKVLQGLRDSEKVAIAEVLRDFEQSNVDLTTDIVRMHREGARMNVAQSIGLRLELAPKDSLLIADKVMQLATTEDIHVRALLEADVLKDLGDAEFMGSLVEAAGQYSKNVDRLESFYQSRAWNISEMRHGDKYQLEWSDGEGNPGWLRFDKKKDFLAKKFQLEKEGKIIERAGEITREEREISVLDPDVLKEIRKFEKVQKDIIKKLPLDDATRSALLKSENISERILRDISARKITDPGVHRRLSGGREDLDLFANHFRYISQASMKSGQKWMDYALRLEMTDPKVRADEELMTRTEQHIENLHQPDTTAGKKITTFNFLYMIGGNISSHIIELSQPFLTLAPELIRNGSGIGQAFKTTFKAFKDTLDVHFRKKKLSDPEAQAAYERAQLDGLFQQLGAFTEAGRGEGFSDISNMHRLLEGKPVGEGKSVSSGVDYLVNTLRSIYGIFTGANARISFLSSWDFYRNQWHKGVEGRKQMSIEEAYRRASKTQNTATFQG